MAEQFTWIPLYAEIAERLLAWEDRQPELIACLEGLREQGVKVTPINDKDKEGNTFVMKEIDPFTFCGSFNRGIRDEERLAILKEVKQLLGATKPLPDDFAGIPILNNMRSWLVPYQHSRGRDDVAKLWQVFREAQSDNPLDSAGFAAAFDNAIKLRGVSTNLTMGLFWIRPDTFLNLDKRNRKYLKIKLPRQGLNAKFYISTVKDVLEQGKPLPEVSYAAWVATSTIEEDELPPDSNYWLVGSYWKNADPQDQTARFLEEGVWQNGYKDKYLDEVRSIQVGDRIGIKSTSTQKNNLPFDAGGNTVSKMTVKAIGEIVANRGDGRTVEVEWDTSFEPKDWYFYTNQKTLWRVRTDPSYPYPQHSQQLVDFVWKGGQQDYEWFLNRWGDASGDRPDDAATDPPFGVEDVVASGAFLPVAELEQMLARLQEKKNLILQGAPGVGKTFIARKLAYALMQQKASARLNMVQFHQSFSYEDFIRGYRPLPDQAGTFGLQDAVFYKFCKQAQDDPDQDYVFIIDEINRGNLSQIFGELLMLIEGDKRGEEFAVPLVYQRQDEPPFYVPQNVYLIGLMNLADRSLAIVDYALRRRFAFATLKPQYASAVFQKWLSDRNMDAALAQLVASRMSSLNQQIATDPLLGENYQIGHSFFCPRGEDFSGLQRSWYEGVVQTEIVPLLKEYWFDNPSRVQQAEEELLAQ